MPEIKAIETRYAGHHFRSRLEARWAVFFDALDMRWEYEPEGYELASGRYLPDFWLANADAFLEVKRPGAPFDQRWTDLAAMTGQHVIVVRGIGENGTMASYSPAGVARFHERPYLWSYPPASAAYVKAQSARFDGRK